MAVANLVKAIRPCVSNLKANPCRLACQLAEGTVSIAPEEYDVDR